LNGFDQLELDNFEARFLVKNTCICQGTLGNTVKRSLGNDILLEWEQRKLKLLAFNY